MKVCIYCDAEIEPKSSKPQGFCNKECRKNYLKRENEKLKVIIRRKCSYCGKTFNTTIKNKFYCSPDCNKSNRKKIVITYKHWACICEYVFERDSYRCVVCGGDGGGLSVHHKLPISLGGDNNYENLELLCNQCHCEKHRIINEKLS